MSFPMIQKTRSAGAKDHNFGDYQQAVDSFQWAMAWQKAAGNQRHLNIAYEAVDRHVEQGYGGQCAMRFLRKTGTTGDITYRELYQHTNQFANLLNSLGLTKGSNVFALAGRVPQLYTALLGSLKAGCVFTPLFSAFGPDPIRNRLEIGTARVLITTEKLYRKKVADWRQSYPSLQHVLLFDLHRECPADCLDLDKMMADQPTDFQLCDTSAEDTALLQFTSGSTGQPKGAIHVHAAVVHHLHSGFYALDLQPGDIYWCTADPGWVTGITYGAISPLCHRATLVVDEGEFDAERWYRILQDHKVAVWYTAPTAIRMLMKAGTAVAQQFDLNQLRFLASVGEPLNPEAVVWAQEVFGKPFHDNWWQTETGGIIVANYACEPVKPGSMGKPLPGVEVTIMSKQEDGSRVPANKPGSIGELAIRTGWPSMFRGYLHEQARYQQCFAGEWYLSGDLAKQDEDGYFWFIGRSNDLIKSSGHLIGPFEVESVLMEHPAVAEAAVIGVPDEMAAEVVKAYVTLNPNFTFDISTSKSIMAHARKKLGPSVAPRQLEERQSLPKTRSGKIMRRLLRARELGLPEGDISTLEHEED